MGLEAQIVHVHQAPHDLKQVPLACLENLFEALSEIGCIFLPVHLSRFLGTDHNLNVLVYVDNIATA